MRRTSGGKNEIEIRWFCFGLVQFGLGFRPSVNNGIIERACEALAVDATRVIVAT